MPFVQVARFMMLKYKASSTIKFAAYMLIAKVIKLTLVCSYAETSLLNDVRKSGLDNCLLTTLRQTICALVPYFNEQIYVEEETHFNSTIHYFKVAKSGNGPHKPTRYYCLERISALPVPYPAKATPTLVHTVIVSSLNCKAPRTRVEEYCNKNL